MSKVSSLLTERLKKGPNTSKMTALAEKSATGGLSGFAGVFSLAELNTEERESLQNLLERYETGEQNISGDLESLISITCEVKAINNQAAILHGERIKRAQTILKNYADGAFSGWLMATYGNRQTPYNFLQYYEFYQAMPAVLRAQIDQMPRQAVYTLASRQGEIEQKQAVVQQYAGQTKEELLQLIRKEFPLNEGDKRRQNDGDTVTALLSKARNALDSTRQAITMEQKEKLQGLLEALASLIDDCKVKKGK